MVRLAGLPVSVELPGELGRELTRFVECEAGWQVVAPSGPPPPALVLTARPQPGRPCVVVVPGRPTADDTRDGLLAGALDVLGWPEGRARLLDLPLRLAEPAPQGPAPAVLRVVGTAGGAGTSTVALALAGLCAWSGHRTVVVGREDLLTLCGAAPWRGPGAEALHALGPGGAAAEFAAVARPVPAVRGLRVLAGDGAALADPLGWPVEVVVADQRTTLPPSPPAATSPLAPSAAAWAALGGFPLTPAPAAASRVRRRGPGRSPLGGPASPVPPPAPLSAGAQGWPPPPVPPSVPAAGGAQGWPPPVPPSVPVAGGALVVVTRPDGTARHAAGLARGAAIIVVGQGPLDRLGIRRLLGRSEDAWLPPSARVARAGLLGRVPSSLPGSWLALLRHTVSATRSAA